MAASREKRPVLLQPPIGGLLLAYAYQNQPDFTTPSCLNVWPNSLVEHRARMGTRPCLENAFAENIGPGEVRLIATVQWKNTSNVVVSTLVTSAAGVTKYSSSAGALVAVTPTAGAALSSTQPLFADELAQKLYIADWDPDATISAAARVPKVYNPADNTLAVLAASAGTVPKGCPAIARYRGRILLAGKDNTVTACRVDDPTDWDAAGATVDDKLRPWAIGSGDAFTIGQKTTALIPTNDQCCIIACTKSIYILRSDPASGGSMNMLDAMVGIVAPGAWCYVPSGGVVFLSHDGLYFMYGGCADHRVEPLSRDRLPDALVNVSPELFIVSMAYDSFHRGVYIMVRPKIEPYGTGTVTIVSGVVTLAGGTWPASAADRRLVVNGNVYEVATRDSDTQLTLENLAVNVGAGASYSLVQETSAERQYFFDFRKKAFWPTYYNWRVSATAMHAWNDYALSGAYTTEYTAFLATHASESNPTSVAAALTGNESNVLIGCSDGYLRWHRRDKATDDGISIESHLCYGPLGFGRGMFDSTIDAINVTLAQGSGKCRITLLAGESPETALNDPKRTHTRVLTDAVKSPWWYPRTLGSDHYVKVSDFDGSQWMIERINLVVSERGMSRGG